MTARDAISEAPLDQRAVLLAAAEAETRGETPANPAELRAICSEGLARDDSPVFGGLSEAHVTRALYRLEDEGLVANERPAATSQTGKGRPAYEPVPAVEAVHSALADDDRLGPMVAALQRG